MNEKKIRNYLIGFLVLPVLLYVSNFVQAQSIQRQIFSPIAWETNGTKQMAGTSSQLITGTAGNDC